LDFSALLVNPVKDTETVVWPKAQFPGRVKWRGLPQRLAIPSLLCRFERQLLFDFGANERVILRLDGTQVPFVAWS